MIFYNKIWLANSILLKAVEKEHRAGVVTDDEWQEIKKRCPVGFYTPNIFIRIGLFILTLTISLATDRLLTLLSGGTIPSNYPWQFLMAALNLTALVILVKRKFHYRSGVDDALLWESFAYLIVAFTSTDILGGVYQTTLFVSVLSLVLTLLFSDILMSLVSYLMLIASVYFFWNTLGTLGVSTMPFILMMISALVYWLVVRNINKAGAYFYTNSMMVVQAASLVTLYASGNYFVVTELWDILNHTDSKSISFGWFFWIWTIAIPLVYVYWGLLRKEVIALRVGLIMCFAAAATVRQYYHLIALELVLIVSGAVILAICWYLTRYFKSPKHGFTYEDLDDNLIDQLHIESLIISETSSGIGTPPANTGTQMGGGKFGGGGASGGF